MNNKVIAISLAAFVAAFLLNFSTPHNVSAKPQPLVLAFYYAWFDQNIWDLSKVADIPTLKYLSNDPTTVARQIKMAQDSGIDVFVVSWWGAGNPTDVNFRSMLDVAAATNFKTAIDFEITSPFYKNQGDVINSLKNLLATHVNHPAYLRSDGKPVIFFWSNKINDFTLRYSVDEWKAIRDQVDPNHQTIWVAEGIDWTYLRVFDGLHLYSIAWSPNVFGELNKWPRRVKSFGAEKLWVATVMPGNDDRKTKRPESYYRDREGGNFYKQTWQAAMATNPEWIIITSWNEWVEGTMIEPSVTYGNLYLDITREYAAKFKSGTGASAPQAQPTTRPTASPAPSASPSAITASPTLTKSAINTDASENMPTARTTDGLRVRAEPDINSEIVGRLAQNVVIPLLGRSSDGKWIQTNVPASDKRGWVSADFLNILGSTDNLPILSTSTIETPTQSLSQSQPTAPRAQNSVPAAVEPSPTPTLAPTINPTVAPTATRPATSLFNIFSGFKFPFPLPFFP